MIRLGKIEANRAIPHVFPHATDGVGEGQRLGNVNAKQMIRQTFGRFFSDTGQFTQLLNQFGYRLRDLGHEATFLLTIHSRYC